MIMSSLYYTNRFIWILIELVPSPWVDMSLQLILIGSLYAPYLVLSREEQIPIFIVVGLTQDDHNKCYTTDTIQI